MDTLNTITTKEKKMNLFNKVIDTVSGIFVPIINYLMAAALLKGLLLFGVNTGLLREASGVYKIFYTMADGFFHFLPIFLAYTASRKLKADKIISMMIAAALVYPEITQLMDSGASLELFGIPVPSVTYPSSVIPILLAVGLLHFVEIPLEKYIHGSVKGFLKPMFALIIVVPITFLLFGPIGKLVGDGLASIYSALYGFSPVAAGAIFGLIWQPMVVFGFHWGLVPVIIDHINTIGRDTVLPMLGPPVMGQAGAAMAVSLLAKSKKLKTVALSGSITGIMGITEPILYGITIPLKRPMVAACIAGSIGGAIVGASHNTAMAFAFPSMISLIVYFTDGFWVFLGSMIGAFILGFVLTLLLRFKETDYKG